MAALLVPIVTMLSTGLHSACLEPNTALILYYYLRDSYTNVPDEAAWQLRKAPGDAQAEDS
jgi:hypothetical protein